MVCAFGRPALAVRGTKTDRQHIVVTLCDHLGIAGEDADDDFSPYFLKDLGNGAIQYTTEVIAHSFDHSNGLLTEAAESFKDEWLELEPVSVQIAIFLRFSSA